MPLMCYVYIALNCLEQIPELLISVPAFFHWPMFYAKWYLRSYTRMYKDVAMVLFKAYIYIYIYCYCVAM